MGRNNSTKGARNIFNSPWINSFPIPLPEHFIQEWNLWEKWRNRLVKYRFKPS